MTRRERFLSEMDAVIPWSRLVSLIKPHYHRSKTGRQPHDLERMLRIYFMQQWFNLSDPQAEDAIYDSESMRRFARVELDDDKVPDESTILRFRHLLEKHGLTESIFEAVKDLLDEHRPPIVSFSTRSAANNTRQFLGPLPAAAKPFSAAWIATNSPTFSIVTNPTSSPCRNTGPV